MEPTKTSETGSEAATKVTIGELRAWRESVTGRPHGYVPKDDDELWDLHRAWTRGDLQTPDKDGVIAFRPTAGTVAAAVARVRHNRGKLAIAARIIHGLTAEQRAQALEAFVAVFDPGMVVVDSANKGSELTIAVDLDEVEIVDAFETWLTKKLFDAAADHEVTAGELPWRKSPPELLEAVREIAFAS